MKPMQTKKLTYWSSVVVIGAVLGISLQFVKAWTDPSGDPVSGNIGAPINTGDMSQTKAGGLVVDGIGSTGGALIKGDIVMNGAVATNFIQFPDGTKQYTASPAAGFVPKGTMVGQCLTNPWGGAVSFVYPMNASCACPSGYTRILTGVTYSQDAARTMRVSGSFYSCIKN